MARVVLSSCDASTHVYSYDDTKDDFDLKNFQLADEDLKYKVFFIKKDEANGTIEN